MAADSLADQNPLILRRWLFVADKIEMDPELLKIPLHNISRWLEAGRIGNPWALLEWKKMIEGAATSAAGMASLLALLRDDGERARQLKSCSPFASVLTRDERDQFTCAWTH
jgi:hypothetical protein